MIIKLNRWKKTEFQTLLKYIDEDKGRGKTNNFSIYHNITIPTVDNAVREFRENDKHRKKRKGGVAIYHEILSFHEKDTPHITPDLLEDIARKYIELRGESALCFAKPHVDGKNQHIHFAFSGTECFSSKTLRLDNKAFRKIRREIEAYQIEKYPELSYSIAYQGRKKKKERKISDKECQFKKRTGQQTDKEMTIEMFNKFFIRCKTFDNFLTMLKDHEFDVYSRGGKPYGISFNNRKFRFSTHGNIQEKYLEREKKSKQIEGFRRVLKLKEIERKHKEGISLGSHHTRDELSDSLRNRDLEIRKRKKELRRMQRRSYQRGLSR